MTHLARLAALVLTLPLLLVAGWQPATAASGTVVFGPGDATSIQDGRTLCVMGTSNAGKGSVICSGEAVYDALWAGTSCDSMSRMGCIVDGRIRGVRLRESGRPQRAWIDGLGGGMNVERGQKIKAGKITGKRLPGGGFRFANSSDHGFRLTNGAYVAR